MLSGYHFSCIPFIPHHRHFWKKAESREREAGTRRQKAGRYLTRYYVSKIPRKVYSCGTQSEALFFVLLPHLFGTSFDDTAHLQNVLMWWHGCQQEGQQMGTTPRKVFRGNLLDHKIIRKLTRTVCFTIVLK